MEGGHFHLQRKSIRSRPSDKRPVDLWKKERPFGRLMGKPSAAASPPVSELESPKLKIMGLFLHCEATGPNIERRSRSNEERIRAREWERGEAIIGPTDNSLITQKSDSESDGIELVGCRNIKSCFYLYLHFCTNLLFFFSLIPFIYYNYKFTFISLLLFF